MSDRKHLTPIEVDDLITGSPAVAVPGGPRPLPHRLLNRHGLRVSWFADRKLHQVDLELAW
jgi:hypothetical protein